MPRVLRPATAFVAAVLLVFVPSALAQGDFADHGAGDNEVTVGSQDSFFSPNKQNEPAVAIDANPASGGRIVAAGANDNIDMERCNAGADNTCPFTDGVGVSGVQFSLDGGATWTQPTYTGWSARNCVGVAEPPDVADNCQPAVGPIGTLPWYFENGLVSDGDPAVAFGPRPGPNGFSWSNGSRLYYANLTSNFSANRSEEAFPGFEAIAVSRTDNTTAAAAGGPTGKAAWMTPVIVSRQNAALFSDKEQIWADNASSSRFFGNVYICNTSFRSVGGAPEPILFARSTDGGGTWDVRQISPAANTGLGQGRQGCTVRTDSDGVVYVFWESASKKKSNPPFFDSAQLMARSFDGGQTFERPRVVASVVDCGQFDPTTGRLSFDGVAGARTNSYPSVDIGNGAPTGAGARNLIAMTWCNGPTPTAAGQPNEQARVQWSLDKGETWSAPVNAAAASDRPDFPAVAVSPDSNDVYLTYQAFHAPWQSTTASPRLQEGVVRHANFAGASLGAFADLHRGVPGDARGSAQNNLVAEFLGDYNYAAATNDYAVAVWNDVRQAADCPAIDAYRMAFLQFVTSGGGQAEDEEVAEVRREAQEKDKQPAPGPPPPTAPEPNNDCPQTPDLAFGNSDIWGGHFADPTSP